MPRNLDQNAFQEFYLRSRRDSNGAIDHNGAVKVYIGTDSHQFDVAPDPHKKYGCEEETKREQSNPFLQRKDSAPKFWLCLYDHFLTSNALRSSHGSNIYKDTKP
jgi:hypothetical protein